MPITASAALPMKKVQQRYWGWLTIAYQVVCQLGNCMKGPLARRLGRCWSLSACSGSWAIYLKLLVCEGVSVKECSRVWAPEIQIQDRCRHILAKATSLSRPGRGRSLVPLTIILTLSIIPFLAATLRMVYQDWQYGVIFRPHLRALAGAR